MAENEKTAEELVAELEALQATLVERDALLAQGARNDAFRDAGLADSPARSLLEKAYEPGMTADQLKELAEKSGIVIAPAPGTQANELEAIRRVQTNSGTGEVAGGLPKFEDAIANAGSLAELHKLIAEHGQGAGIELRERVI